MGRTARVLAGMLLVSSCATAMAGVGDPQIRTDHPLYPGELAYSTQERFARSIIDSGDWGLGLGNSERDVALKLWLWKITHTLHDYTPATWTPLHDYNRATFKTHSVEHSVRPDPAIESFSALDQDQDCLRWQFSYGYALCGTLHGVIEPQIEAIGKALGKDWRSRRVGIPGDNNHEIYFGGKWHLFDVNAATLLWSSNDAKTAELLPFKDGFGPKGGPKRPELLDNAPKFNGTYLPKLVWGKIDQTGKPGPYSWMRGIFETPEFYWDTDEIGQRNHGDLTYYFSYSACPVVYALKRGETFTRWFDGEQARAEMRLPRRIWWGSNIKGGPGSQREFAHYLRDLPECCSDTDPLVFATDSQLNQKYCVRDLKVTAHGNGLYDWQPNLAADDWKDGAVSIKGPVRNGKGAGLTADGPASVTFGFFSPYVIAAMPADDTDPGKDGATSGAVIEAAAAGQVPVEVSINNGLTFEPVGSLKGHHARIDFSDAVKGRNQYQLRIRLDRGQGLKSMRLRTVVTTCRAMYPKLKSGKTTITYAADGLNGFEASPGFASKEMATRPESFVAQEDLEWDGYKQDGKIAWRTDKEVASCVYKVCAPKGRTLTSVSAAANITWPTPTREGSWGEVSVAASPEGPWQVIRKIDPRADDSINKNDLSSYWVYGTANVAGQNLPTAYVRFRFAGSGHACGIRFLNMFGTYAVDSASPLTITYHWKSGQKGKQHTETVPAGAAEHKYTIDTGNDVKNAKVVFAVRASK